jgi:hypothetical protein
MPVNYKIVADVVRDTAINLQYTLQGIVAFGQIDRIYQVEVQNQIDPKLVMPGATLYMQTQVPVGTPHPVYTFCTARQYQGRSLESDTTVNICVSYIFNQIPVDTTVWTIESDNYLEMEETDSQYSLVSGQPSGPFVPIAVGNYILDWRNPADPKPITPAQGTTISSPEAPQTAAYVVVTSPRPRKRWTYSKQIYSQTSALTYDNATIAYVGCVNAVTYIGTTANQGFLQNLSLAPGTVLCMDAGVAFSPYQGQYIARAVMVYKPEGWEPWARFSNSTLGVPDNLWRQGPSGPSSGGAASAGFWDANGTVRATPVPSIDLNAILALI